MGCGLIIERCIDIMYNKYSENRKINLNQIKSDATK